MIHRIRIRNFGSLYDIDVELGPLTLLLGPNASGKSMFIRALRTISKLIRSPIRGQKKPFTIDHATLDDLASGHGSRPISFSLWLEKSRDEPNYILEIDKVEGVWAVTKELFRFEGFHYDSKEPFEFGTERRGAITWGTPGLPPQPPRHASLPYLAFPYREDSVALTKIAPILKFARQFGLIYGYRVSPTELVSPRLPTWVHPWQAYTQTTGSGFVFALQRFSQTVGGRKILEEKIQPALHSLFPHIRGIGFRNVQSFLFLEYETDRSKRAISAELESDGVNLALFFLSIPYLVGNLEDEPMCLCFEEPESGTHPYLQSSRLELLRKIASGKVTERPMQVIATTHSLELLRWVKQEETLDLLRFVEHLGPEKGTQIHRLSDQAEIDAVYTKYKGNPGTAWYSGVFGGVPELPSSEEDL